MKPILLLAASALMLCTASCVSKKKFVEAETGRLAALERAEKLSTELNLSRTTNDRLAAELERLRADTLRLGNSIRTYQQMLAGNVNSQEKLTAMLNKKMKQLAERENTINELQSMISAQKEKVAALLNSVKDALLGFNSDELTVREENGKVYVAMSDKLLFQSGSARVDNRGKEALAKLAQVLNRQNNIDVYIEGHTDNKSIHTTQFKDNWDLSVIRATSVVRILTDEYQVNPLQILPCGRAYFMPVADNATAEGRARNRRTEIIMAPKLDELYKMLQSNAAE